MSEVNDLILKATTDCDAVNYGLTISKVCSIKKPETKKLIKSAIVNNGTKLNDFQHENINIESIETSKLPNKSVKQESRIDSVILLPDRNFSDVQKVLEHEQELQKQLYSGANVANGWFRVNHNNKVIYISPSGIGLTSLKQVKDYLLTRGTCKCGLPFPLRIELFFNFDIHVTNAPLRAPIDGIKYDPYCQHKKKLMTSNNRGNHQINASNNQFPQETGNLKKYKKTKKECLLPSYVTSVNNKISQSNNNSESAVRPKSSKRLATNNIQQLVMQSKNQQTQFLQQIDAQNMSNLVNLRIVKEENDIPSNSKLPPWYKNVMQSQVGSSSKPTQPSIISTTHGGIPIFQINGQMITIDQQNPQFSNQPQKVQFFEQKPVDNDKMVIRRRPPSFKEDPTEYLNQQTALLNNTITTLHSPDISTSAVSPTTQENSSEFLQRHHIAHQTVKTPNISNQQTQNISMSNAIVQMQSCDSKQLQQQPKVSTVQDQMQFDHQKLRTNPKGRPPKHSRRLLSIPQESPVSSSTTNNMVKIAKSSTPDITSSSAEAVTETIVQTPNNFDGPEVLKYARISSTQELIRTSMAQVLAGKSACLTTSSSSSSSIRKPAATITSIQRKPQTIVTQMKTNSNSSISNNSSLLNQLASNSNQQIMMTSNGQQFIIMPSSNLQTQSQNLVLNNNSIVQIQNSNQNHQRLVQSTGSGQNGNIIIQTNNGNILATTAQTSPNNFIVNGQPLIFQNSQIIQSNSNLIMPPKNNILLAGGASTSSSKTLFGGNNHMNLGQQTVLLQNSLTPQQTFVNDSAYLQNIAQQQQQKVILNPEKKKGRKRKNPLPDTSVHQQAAQQSSLIQIPTTATSQSFHISSPNILVQNKFSQPTAGQQIILQNGQTFIQQPMNFIGNQQIIPSHLMTLSSDGNSFLQIQNPPFNNIMTAPQNIIRTAPTHQQLQPLQKTIITNNGQQYIVQGGGQVNLMNQLPFNSMGFVVQSATHQNQQQQQILNPIVIQPQGHQIISQPQILTHTPTHITTTQLSPQQAQQFLNQNEYNNKVQRKIMLQHKTQQQNSLFPQIINKSTRTTTGMHYASSSKNPILMQNIIEEHDDLEDDEDNHELVEQSESCEQETDERELSFDEKPDMIEELHHGTSQQILHSSSMIDGQCGIMNIDDITIEMDEINDLNEYLNAIDEEDNKISQMGLSSLQHFANSPPDTTTHSPRSPDIITNAHHVFNSGSEKSNGSSECNNMVSSSELDSNVVSPECHQIIESTLSHHHPNTTQPVFKLPLEPRSSSIRSPPLYSMINTTNFFDNNSQSPLHPDSHESSTSEHQHKSNTHCQNKNCNDFQSYLCSTMDLKDDNRVVIKKSDFDLLKESPILNNIKPMVGEDNMIKSNDPSCCLSSILSNDLLNKRSEDIVLNIKDGIKKSENKKVKEINDNCSIVKDINSKFKIGDLIWGTVRGYDAWPGKIVNGPDNEPISSNCVWVKWFNANGRQNTEMVQCSTLKSLSDGLEAHHLARKETRKSRKLNIHLERAIQKAMKELDKQSPEGNLVK